jgi:hypothetical protein
MIILEFETRRHEQIHSSPKKLAKMPLDDSTGCSLKLANSS